MLARMALGLLILGSGALTDGASAATLAWDGPAAGQWHTATNWTSDTVPGPNDIAFINSSATVTISGADASVGKVSSGSGGTVVVDGRELTLTAAGDAASDPLSGPFINVKNGGTVRMQGIARFGGSMVLGDTDGPPDTGTLLLDGTNTQISGAGVSEAALGKGTVRVLPGKTLHFTSFDNTTIAAAFENDGTVELESEAFAAPTVFITSTAAAPASDGTWAIGDGTGNAHGHLVLNPAAGVTFTVNGPMTGPGRLTVQEAPPFSGGGTVNVLGTFDLARLTINNKALLDLDVDGTVDEHVNGGGFVGGLVGDGDLTVTGPGASSIGGFTDGRVAGAGTTTFQGPLTMLGMRLVDGSRVVTAGATTVPGHGEVRLGNPGGSGTWENSGTITVQDDADPFTAATLTDLGGGVLRNLASGTITRTTPGTWFGSAPIENAGTINLAAGQIGSTPTAFVPTGALTQTGGTTTIGAGAVLEKAAALAGGVLQGGGSVRSVDNAGGTVRPGSSPGTLTVLGDYAQGASGVLETEVAGTAPGTQFDVLAVGGTASLGGTLAILSSGFTPALADTFRILTAGARTGQWASKTGAAVGSLSYLDTYQADGATLCVVGGTATECGKSTAPVTPVTQQQQPSPAPSPPAPSPAVQAPRPAAPVAVAPPPAPVSEAQVLSFPSTRRCASRRSFSIRLRTPRGATVTSASVKVNGRQVQVVRGARLRAPVNLRSLPRGRFTVSIELTLADGRVVRGTRKYRTCAPKRRASRRSPRV